MNELIQQIVAKTGIPADKAQQVLGVVSGFPAIGGQIDSVLGTGEGKAGGGTALPVPTPLQTKEEKWVFKNFYKHTSPFPNKHGNR